MISAAVSAVADIGNTYRAKPDLLVPTDYVLPTFYYYVLTYVVCKNNIGWLYEHL